MGLFSSLKKVAKKLDPVGSKIASKDPVGKKLLGSSGGSKSAPGASMPPPPNGRATGGAGRVSATQTAKPMPKPTLRGKQPTGGSAPVAGSRSGVGRLAQTQFQGNRRMIDKRSPK